jgi:hypothetical protein
MIQIRRQVLNRSSAPIPRPTRARGDGDAWASSLTIPAGCASAKVRDNYRGTRLRLWWLASRAILQVVLTRLAPMSARWLWTVKSKSVPRFLAIPLGFFGEMAPDPSSNNYQIVIESQSWCCARPSTLAYTSYAGLEPGQLLLLPARTNLLRHS